MPLKTEEVQQRLELLMPSDDLMKGRWVACLSWAMGSPDMRAAYEAETGKRCWTPGQTSIDRMIDEACGVAGESVLDFAAWFKVAVWGPET